MDSSIRSHIIDSCFFGEGYCTAEGQKIFSDLARMQRWLDVEVALAESQGDLGIIPHKAAEELARTGKLELLDLDKIQQGIARTKHSLLPLLQAWQEIANGEIGQYIHYGATTQDIQDTAQVLEIRDVINIVERDLGAIIQILAGLASKYRNLVIVGRTHGQHALPTTLGLKIAGWLDENTRNYERLQFCKKNVLVSQLFGGVGTMAAFSQHGILLIKRFSERLGLRTPGTAWHNARDRFAELLAVFALITGTLGKIANEIIQLNKNGIDELSEPFSIGQVGSSTMPHKRNPETCERIVTLSRLVKSHAGLGFDALCSEHERDYRSVRLEWVSITDASLYVCCALDMMKFVLEDIVVHEDNIKRNVENSAQYISSEAVMFSLGKKIGKQNAHKLVYEAAMQSATKRTTLLQELMQLPAVAENFSGKELEEVMRPTNYLGLAGLLVDNVVLDSRERIDFCRDNAFVRHESVLLFPYQEPLVSSG